MMSTHRSTKQPFSRMSDGMTHPVEVRTARPAVDLDVDPHLWGAYGDMPLSSIVGMDADRTAGRIEPGTAVVAHHDVDAPASPRFDVERNRRAGIPVPQMDRMHPVGHVDAIANTHGDDR